MLPNNLSNKKIVISGTLAYDKIMNFPGYFKDHILPDKLHILNVCFPIGELRESFGGTAGNIAYNLSLLNEEPVLLSAVGNDFGRYKEWLRKNHVNISMVKKFRNEFCSAAYIITDKADNQITGFYDGPSDCPYCRNVEKINNVDLAIIAPEVEKRMMEYVGLYKKLKIPYIFDPGQQIPNFTRGEIKSAVQGSKVLIGNDYEIALIVRKLGISRQLLERMAEILVITKGGKGSEIYQQGKKLKIPPAKPKNTSDPTGAGDAYRAGFIKGLMEGWPLEKTGRLAGLVAVYTVEKYGTQTHRFTWASLARRYKDNFREKL